MIARFTAVACLALVACGTGDAGNEAGEVSATSVPPVSTVVSPPATSAPAATTVPPAAAAVGEPPATAVVTEPVPLGTAAVAASCVRVTDFDAPDWVIVNDGVMGGQSVGEGAIVNGVLVFDGTIVTRGGGFTSVRGSVDGRLTGATELVMRVRTDGRSYELLADDASSARERVTHYRPIEVEGESGEWQEVSVPLADMEARVFGTPVLADPFQPDLATQIGVILADGVDGPFSFEIDWIDACP